MFLSVVCYFASISQTPEINLAKYWNYRQMLKTDFMMCSDPESLGHFIPAENRHDLNGFLRWGDATWHMGHYLCVLATEYRLLKDNNQDVTATADELLNLIYSLKRLDESAETYFGGSEDLNGFFIRDDVPEDFHLNFPGINTIYSDFFADPTPSEMSQDQVWSQLVGLALVKKLVDDPMINQEAKDLTWRIVDAMHYITEDDIYIWEIINPVTLEIVQSNDDVGGLCHGFGEAATWITEQNCHFGLSNTDYKKSIFEAAQETIIFNIYFHPYNVFGIEALSAVGDINFTDYDSLYDWLVYVYNETEYHIHFPLVHQLLHGFDGTEMMDVTEFEELINSAPFDGPYYYDVNNHSPDPWNKVNLIACPWHDSEVFSGRYNGLDYMLLYNLYFLVYNNQPIPYRLVTPDFPLEQDWEEFVIGDGSHQVPITIPASRMIEANNHILSEGNVTYTTGEKILLSPGFYAENGCFFLANIDPTIGKDIYYINNNDNNTYKYFMDFKVEATKNINFTKATIFDYRLHPNPNIGKFNIEINNSDKKLLSIYVFDIMGNEIYRNGNPSNTIEIDISNFTKGIYFVKIQIEGDFYTKKVIYD